NKILGGFIVEYGDIVEARGEAKIVQKMAVNFSENRVSKRRGANTELLAKNLVILCDQFNIAEVQTLRLIAKNLNKEYAEGVKNAENLNGIKKIFSEYVICECRSTH